MRGCSIKVNKGKDFAFISSVFISFSILLQNAIFLKKKKMALKCLIALQCRQKESLEYSLAPTVSMSVANSRSLAHFGSMLTIKK